MQGVASSNPATPTISHEARARKARAFCKVPTLGEFNLILLEPLLIILGVIAFAVWQFLDLKKAREQSRQRRERADNGTPPPSSP
ncbi:MAG: hypothetical protein RLZ58_438 [Pseudomonadota bacterium]